MFMWSAAMVALRGRAAARGGPRRSFWPLAAFCPAESCGGARRGARFGFEAKGLYGRALKPVGLDAAGLGVAGGEAQ